MSYGTIRGCTQNFEVYDETDGSERLLGLATVDLPELEYLTSDLKGAGILGEFSMAVVGHTSNLTTTLHFRTLNDDVTGLGAPTSHTLALYVAMQDYNSATGVMNVVPVKVKFRGVPTKATLGSVEPGEQSESENEFSIDYMKIKADGTEILEIDKFNYVFRVNGVDYLADTREALGR